MTGCIPSTSVRRFVLYICLVSAVLLKAAAQQSTSVPDPSIASHPEWPAAKNASDVDPIDHLVASLYDVISGPAGAPRDWQRFPSLFLPDGRLGVVIAESAATADAPGKNGDVIFVSPVEYVARHSLYFQTHGSSSEALRIASRSSET